MHKRTKDVIQEHEQNITFVKMNQKVEDGLDKGQTSKCLQLNTYVRQTNTYVLYYNTFDEYTAFTFSVFWRSFTLNSRGIF